MTNSTSHVLLQSENVFELGGSTNVHVSQCLNDDCLNAKDFIFAGPSIIVEHTQRASELGIPEGQLSVCV